MAFINDDFLLTTDEAKELFHGYAEKMPIIDYHCHLPPAEIAEDRRWENIAQVWLGGDHYKWRQMRSNGVDEKFITGDADWHDKFVKFAETMEVLLKNPLFDWSHLELARYFGVEERLSRATAESIWERCNSKMLEPDFSARGLMVRSNVRVVCTTDDPVDSLEHHKAIADGGFSVKVLPTWRSDKASKIDDAPAWNDWMDRLAAAAGSPVRTWDDFLDAMDRRHAFFESRGCVLSDYGVTEIFAAPYTTAEIKAIFKKVREGGAATPAEALKFKSAWLYEGLRADARANWTTQLHYCCLRNANTRMMRLLGPDTGFDCIGEWNVAESLARLFDRLELEDSLPRTILYSLNPKDNEMLATLMGSFQKAPARGKIQLGAAWWFLDQKDGMKKQIEALSALGCLGNFVGMLTDSRSFLSYTRHEYFRRILCAKLGEEMARGEIPHDIPWVGGIVADISYNNANRYFFGAR
jgi:glucuronate isomerase